MLTLSFIGSVNKWDIWQYRQFSLIWCVRHRHSVKALKRTLSSVSTASPVQSNVSRRYYTTYIAWILVSSMLVVQEWKCGVWKTSAGLDPLSGCNPETTSSWGTVLRLLIKLDLHFCQMMTNYPGIQHHREWGERGMSDARRLSKTSQTNSLTHCNR